MQEVLPISPAPVTPILTPPVQQHAEKHECCGDGKCGTCLKGGMPFKKEKLSFFLLITIGLTTVFFALWVHEMRKNDQVVEKPVNSMAVVEAVKYATPAAIPAVSVVDLPAPSTSGGLSVEAALLSRRSRRTYSEVPVTLEQLGQVLWAGQGVTDEATGHRTAPSARSLYPYTLYVVVRTAEGLKPGLYRYEPLGHKLSYLGMSDVGEKLAAAGVQDNSQKAPVVIVLAAAVSKVVEKFPDDPRAVVMLEGGHIGQNIYLQVESMDMSTVVTAGFDTAKVGSALGLDQNEEVVYLVPFGHTSAEEVAE